MQHLVCKHTPHCQSGQNKPQVRVYRKPFSIWHKIGRLRCFDNEKIARLTNAPGIVGNVEINTSCRYLIDFAFATINWSRVRGYIILSAACGPRLPSRIHKSLGILAFYPYVQVPRGYAHNMLAGFYFKYTTLTHSCGYIHKQYAALKSSNTRYNSYNHTFCKMQGCGETPATLEPFNKRAYRIKVN